MIVQPKPLEYFIKKAKIVIDTNVLLQAYQYKGIEIEKVLEQLEWFLRHDRLIIPSQVVTEFTKRREGLIKKIENSLFNITNEVDKVKIYPNQSLKEICPLFTQTEEFKKAVETKDKILDELNNYKDLLSSLHNKVVDLFDEDRILERIQRLINKSYFLPDSLGSEEALEREGKERFSKNIPPGLKDKGKLKDGADSDPYGDFKIWAHILKIDADVLFITYDEKNDWFIKGGNGRSLIQRRELFEEFYNITGFQFRAIAAKNLIGLRDFPNELQVEILKIVGDGYKIETFYDKAEELYQWVVKNFQDEKGLVHIMNDVMRLDEVYAQGVKYSFAEMCISYVEGTADKTDFQNLMNLSYIGLQERWDSRFDLFDS
ncbi:DUF4935 domain-containing protein [Paenibacillus sp. EKM202P]|uniref:PIN-like domain-containing protein n=1 Tax=unclassified Paenibacillus TaxID=185978 RepID=UPI0013ED0C32|nr:MULTISPECIES: PIN-like domain-containing protein [unclassified Paenibacillus]KAF6558316.1 DUF4935 domain-containing protein [Paenibacillus sp. EKM202P]KAF6563248.1 DUF4935 domain-containing protein [Paenibacillus sp. EKM207P]